MEEFIIKLNNFLFNSGVLGFYRIMQHMEKDDLLKINGNTITVKAEALNDFESDYIHAMLSKFREDTRWDKIISYKSVIANINLNENEKQFENIFKFVKQAVESASYKSGYESIKNISEINPYELLKQSKEADNNEKKESLLKIIEHIEKYKEIYCMKDIIYCLLYTSPSPRDA